MESEEWAYRFPKPLHVLGQIVHSGLSVAVTDIECGSMKWWWWR